MEAKFGGGLWCVYSKISFKWKRNWRTKKLIAVFRLLSFCVFIEFWSIYVRRLFQNEVNKSYSIMKKVIMKKVTLKKFCLRRDLTFCKNLYLKVPSFVGIFFVMFELRIMIAAKDFWGDWNVFIINILWKHFVIKNLFHKYCRINFCNWQVPSFVTL